MRGPKLIAIAAVVALALVPVPGNAAVLAECEASSPTITGVPSPTPSIILEGKCTAPLVSPGVITVTMSVQPDAPFTGTLFAAVRKPGTNTGIGINGLYAAGILLLGESSRTFQIDAGAWELEVHAGSVPPCILVPPGICPNLRIPSFGSFSGSIVDA